MQKFIGTKMEKSYSKNDTLKGYQPLGMVACIAIGLGGLFGSVKHVNANSSPSLYDLKQETKIVRQESNLELLSECEGGMK